MTIKPHTIDIVVADMARALAFYRTLGLDAPQPEDGAFQVQIVTPGGTRSASSMRRWCVDPIRIGSRRSANG